MLLQPVGLSFAVPRDGLNMTSARMHDRVFGAFVIFMSDISSFDKHGIKGLDELLFRIDHVFGVKDGVDARVLGIRRHSVSNGGASSDFEYVLVRFDKLTLLDHV